MPERLVVNDTTQVICDAWDPEEDPLVYYWTTDAGRIIGGGSRIKWVAPSQLGAYEAQVEVSDGLRSTNGFTIINVVPDTVVYFFSDFSNDDVTTLWNYQGLLSGLGILPASNIVKWDSTLQKMAITSRSDYSCSSFRMARNSYGDGHFQVSVEATSTQFGWIAFMPKFLGESNYFFIGINYYQQTLEVLRCVNGTLEYISRYDEERFSAEVEYILTYDQFDGQAAVKLNNTQIWVGNIGEPFLNSCPIGVGVYGLMDSGPALFDNIRITNR